jgi:hypothetical protein
MPSISFLFRAVSRGSTIQNAVPKRGKMEDPVVEMLAWLFVKTDEELAEEAELSVLYSMLVAPDPRPERTSTNS